jgi:sodium-dependent dicarboxylate transporter 2/3/5
MWMSNTATTAMMYPIGLSIAAHLARTGGTGAPQFALAAMLMTAFAASIGGIATPVGTPPNLIGIGMIERLTGTDITFFQWMLIGLPVTVALFAFLGVYFQLTCIRGVRLTSGSTDAVRQELRTMGPVSPGQRNVLIAFGITVLLWITPGVLALARADQSAFGRAYAQMVPESVAAMLGALLLFVLPLEGNEGTSTLTWKQASRIDWGIILLYGGGLTMGELAFSTGLAEAMGKGITDWMPVSGTVSLTLLFTGVAIVLSEATSNTAAANMIIPIAIAVAQAAGVRPLEPALGATLGASMGFMMPVSTPPNAIVYGSGHVPLSAMIRYGLALDLAGFVVISAAVLLLGPLVF